MSLHRDPGRRRRTDFALVLLLLAILVGCSRTEPPPPPILRIGPHQIRLLVPPGWEHLDHGRQQLFRWRDNQISLMTYEPVPADSGSPDAELDSLWIRRRVLSEAVQSGRHEVAQERYRTIHGVSWLQVDTWDRTSHLARSRSAWTGHGGTWLVLAIDRGPHIEAEPAFEALLTSIEFVAAANSSP